MGVTDWLHLKPYLRIVAAILGHQLNKNEAQLSFNTSINPYTCPFIMLTQTEES